MAKNERLPAGNICQLIAEQKVVMADNILSNIRLVRISYQLILHQSKYVLSYICLLYGTRKC